MTACCAAAVAAFFRGAPDVTDLTRSFKSSFLRMCCQFFFSSFGRDLLVLNRGVKCDQSLAGFFLSLSFFFLECQIKHKDGRNQIKRTPCALCRPAATPRCPASNEATQCVSECVTTRLPNHLEGGEKRSGSRRQQPDLPRSCQAARRPLGKRPQGQYRCCGRLLECCSKQEADRRV